MSDFHDVAFTVRQPFGVQVATQRRIDVIALASGHETRNARTADALRRYTIPIGTRPIGEIRAALSFFEARGGPLHAFRFRDPLEQSTAADGGAPGATDAAIGEGDGASDTFQLATASGRTIRKPEASSVLVALDGVAVDAAAMSVDPATGRVTIAPPPAVGALVTAGCRFDVPVRFENRSLSVTRADDRSGSLDDLVLVEVIA